MLRIERSAWLLAIASAILQVVIFPLANLYVLGWIAVAPLMVAILRARRPETLQLEGSIKLLPATPLQGFLLGYLCGILWYAGNCYWIYNTMEQYGGIGPIGAAGLLLLFCLYLGLYHGLFGLVTALIARKSLRGALVLSPFVWVAVELARTRITGFPWDLLGIVQVDNLPLARIARATGVYGLSLEIMVVNTAFAAAWLLRRNRRTSLLFAAVAAAFVLQIARWMPIPVFPTDRSAVLVQENVPVLDSGDWTHQYFDETLDRVDCDQPEPSDGGCARARSDCLAGVTCAVLQWRSAVPRRYQPTCDGIPRMGSRRKCGRREHRVAFANCDYDFQLRISGEPVRRVDSALRQNASRPIRRVCSVQKLAWVCRRADQRSRRLYAGQSTALPCRQAMRNWACLSATNRFSPTKIRQFAKSRRAGAGQHFERRLVRRQRSICAASEAGTHAGHRK